MPYTIVLSGPRVSESQARNALAAQRFDVAPIDHDHGLPAHPSGEPIREPQSFVTVEGDDVDKARAAVGSLGWVLRMHHETPEPAQASPEQVMADRLAALEAEMAFLKGRFA